MESRFDVLFASVCFYHLLFVCSVTLDVCIAYFCIPATRKKAQMLSVSNQCVSVSQ
jgi:hypothetical protein